MEQLKSWLTAAFAEQPGWVISDQKSMESFQQSIERVTLTWPDTGATEVVFVRVYLGLMSWWTLATPDLPRRELAAAKIARQAGIPTVETFYQSLDGPSPMVIQKCSPGKHGSKPWNRETVLDLAQTLARLHTASIREEDRQHLPDLSLPVLLARFQKWADEAEDADAQAAVELLAKQFAEIEERPGALVHGDAHPGNFLFQDNRVMTVLDWEEAGIGDPRIDISMLTWCLGEDNPELVADFVTCYEEHAGFTVGPTAPWRELCAVRAQVIKAWVEHSLAHNYPLPTANPTVWLE